MAVAVAWASLAQGYCCTAEQSGCLLSRAATCQLSSLLLVAFT